MDAEVTRAPDRDRRLVRPLMKPLRAGVMEDGELREVDEGDAAGRERKPASGEHLLALRVRPVGPPVEEAVRARRDVRRALRRRLRDGLSARAGRARDAGGACRRLAEFGLSCTRRRPGCFGSGGSPGRTANAMACRHPEHVRLPWVHAHRRARPAGRVPTEAPHLTEEKQGEAGRFTRADAPASASAGPDAARLALQRDPRALPILRRAHEQPRAAVVPRARPPELARPAPTAEPTRAMERRAARGLRQAVPSSAPEDPPSLAFPASRASVDPRWEPGAGNPLAGFFVRGGGSRLDERSAKGRSLPGPGRYFDARICRSTNWRMPPCW